MYNFLLHICKHHLSFSLYHKAKPNFTFFCFARIPKFYSYLFNGHFKHYTYFHFFFRYLFSFMQRYISSSREILNPHISSLSPHPSSLPWATLSPVWSLEDPQSTKATPTSIRDLLALWPFLQAPPGSCWGFHE